MAISKSTVYVIQNPESKDISEAKSFGNIRVILSGKESLQEAVVILRQALINFKETDYIVLVGKSVIMGIATHFALEATGGIVQFLVWQWETQSYKIQHINTYGNNNR